MPDCLFFGCEVEFDVSAVDVWIEVKCGWQWLTCLRTYLYTTWPQWGRRRWIWKHPITFFVKCKWKRVAWGYCSTIERTIVSSDIVRSSVVIDPYHSVSNFNDVKLWINPTGWQWYCNGLFCIPSKREIPHWGSISYVRCDCRIPRVWVPEVDYSVIIIVVIKIILRTIAIEIARPCELVYSAIVIIILVIRTSTATVYVLISYAIIIVIH